MDDCKQRKCCATAPVQHEESCRRFWPGGLAKSGLCDVGDEGLDVALGHYLNAISELEQSAQVAGESGDLSMMKKILNMSRQVEANQERIFKEE